MFFYKFDSKRLPTLEQLGFEVDDMIAYVLNLGYIGTQSVIVTTYEPVLTGSMNYSLILTFSKYHHTENLLVKEMCANIEAISRYFYDELDELRNIEEIVKDIKELKSVSV